MWDFHKRWIYFFNSPWGMAMLKERWNKAGEIYIFKSCLVHFWKCTHVGYERWRCWELFSGRPRQLWSKCRNWINSPASVSTNTTKPIFIFMMMIKIDDAESLCQLQCQVCSSRPHFHDDDDDNNDDDDDDDNHGVSIFHVIVQWWW